MQTVCVLLLGVSHKQVTLNKTIPFFLTKSNIPLHRKLRILVIISYSVLYFVFQATAYLSY